MEKTAQAHILKSIGRLPKDSYEVPSFVVCHLGNMTVNIRLYYRKNKIIYKCCDFKFPTKEQHTPFKLRICGTGIVMITASTFSSTFSVPVIPDITHSSDEMETSSSKVFFLTDSQSKGTKTYTKKLRNEYNLENNNY